MGLVRAGLQPRGRPADLVVAVVWWLAVAAVVGGIVWAEGKRREKMRLAFIGEGVVYNPEAGLVMPDAGGLKLAALEPHAFPGMAFPDEVAALDERVRPRSAGWCGAASSTATARSGRARSSPPTTPRPSRAPSRPARTWPPCWRRRGSRHSQRPEGGRRSGERQPPLLGYDLIGGVFSPLAAVARALFGRGSASVVFKGLAETELENLPVALLVGAHPLDAPLLLQRGQRSLHGAQASAETRR